MQQPYPVSRVAGNRVWHDWHAVSSPQSRLDAYPARAAAFAHSLDTLEALHNLTRSGASSPPSRMSPAAPLPDRGIPAR